jgi:hypothetical protein
MSNSYDKDQLIEQAYELRSQGKSNTEISRLLGVPRSTLHDWIGGSVTKIITEEIVDDDGDVVYDNSYTRVVQSTSQSEDDILAFLQSLAPMGYSAPVRSEVRQTANDIAVVIGDTHFGFECNNTINIFFETVRQLKPKRIILNGDTLDMFAIGKYPKDPRHVVSLEDEKNRYHAFLKTLHDITEPWDAEILETNANHSGNSQEGRLWRYISQQMPALANMERVQELLTFEKIFYPQESWCRVKLVDEVVLPTNLIVRHGTVVRKNGGMSARGEFEKTYCSTLTNHVHRLGSTMQRHPAIGNRPEEVYVNYENGCACDLNPSYVKDPNWQNGFSIVNYSEDVVGVEQVLVRGNAATVCSLGKTLRV